MSAVFGNASFTKVEDLAGRLSNITASDGVINTLTANSVTTQHLAQNAPGDGIGTTTYQITGYAPTGFSTLATNGIQFLNTAPNKPAATSLTSQFLLILPITSQIHRCELTNNGTVIAGATTFDLGNEAWTTAPTGVANLFAAVPLANVNYGVSVGQVADTGFATTGTPIASVTIGTANNGVIVQALGANNTTGDLALRITYVV
jgi:hypothetical protein